MAFVDRHNRRSGGVIPMGDHDVAAPTMDFNKTHASESPKQASPTDLRRSAHAALDAIRRVWKLARGLGTGRPSFFRPSK